MLKFFLTASATSSAFLATVSPTSKTPSAFFAAAFPTSINSSEFLNKVFPMSAISSAFFTAASPISITSSANFAAVFMASNAFYLSLYPSLLPITTLLWVSLTWPTKLHLLYSLVKGR